MSNLPNSSQPSTGNPNLDTIVTILRYVLVIVASWIAAKGEISQDTVMLYGGIAITIGVAAYGAWRTHNWSSLFKVVAEELQKGSTAKATETASKATKTTG